MNENESQKEIVREILEKNGEISNKWCIDHGIWRLSAVILMLRREGLKIETEYNTERVGKNTHYILKPKNTLF